METSGRGDRGRAEADTREIAEGLELYSRPPKHGHLWASHSGEGNTETVVPEGEEEVEGSRQIETTRQLAQCPQVFKDSVVPVRGSLLSPAAADFTARYRAEMAQAKECLERARETAARYYDRHHRELELGPGDWMLVHREFFE
uniref:Uncharacterized protein n=1 Tax=Chromera velia CCMP2878 TaxID=1169474 RepID=A0A0G4I6R9_9ALVE|eukprot:Cvel_1908.t1-p1 / transcript=Cvel_1908.t1 / gene=Cvel_1908 / organism=Chromera_velia_CCMP2878 / gene_product=hypothetical protein / transcript_product=hypothetical protein / location=Cvel_scaffold71:111986-115641(-) / protein_length=143 / sequence_SO=supercontig / SO=protein_coding / is_pseudo=false